MKKTYGKGKVIFHSTLCVILIVLLAVALIGSLTASRWVKGKAVLDAASSIPFDEMTVTNAQGTRESFARWVLDSYMQDSGISEEQMKTILHDGDFSKSLRSDVWIYLNYVRSGMQSELPDFDAQKFIHAIDRNADVISDVTGSALNASQTSVIRERISPDADALNAGLKRDIRTKEIAGSIACDGYASAISSLFGTPPVTSFSQNVGLINMTGVVNRFTLMTGACVMIVAGLLPPVGNFFASLPQAVLGGCTIMMFGTILTSGIQMIAKCGFSQRNITIASLSLAVGIGFTTSGETGIWHAFPELARSVFANNVVAVVFLIAIFLNLVLPKDMDIRREEVSGSRDEKPEQ